MRFRRGTLLVVVLLLIGGSLLAGGLVGFRAWLRHRPHRGPVRSVAVSPDGKLVATASDDRTIKLWDASALGPEPAPQALESLFGHRKGATAVAFLRDGRIASGSADGEVRIWSAAGKALLAHRTREREPVAGLAAFGERRVIAACSWGVTILDPSDDTEQSVVYEGTRQRAPSPRVIAISRDGATAVVGHSSGSLEVIATGAVFAGRELGHEECAVTAVDLAPDATRVVAGNAAGELSFWDARSGACLRRVNEHGGAIVGVAWLARGKSVASVGRDSSVRVTSVESGQELSRVTLRTDLGAPTSLAVSPDGRWVVVGLGSDESNEALETGALVRIGLEP